MNAVPGPDTGVKVTSQGTEDIEARTHFAVSIATLGRIDEQNPLGSFFVRGRKELWSLKCERERHASQSEALIPSGNAVDQPIISLKVTHTLIHSPMGR